MSLMEYLLLTPGEITDLISADQISKGIAEEKVSLSDEDILSLR